MLTISFRWVGLAYSALWLALALTLVITPGLIYWLFGLPGHETADVLARRAGVLFFALATIAYSVRNAPHSNLRQSVLLGMSVSMFGLLALGVFEWVQGSVGPGIWVAIVGELVFGTLSSLVWLNGKGK